MRRILLLFIVLIFTGCSTMTETVLQQRKNGIIQSCYTTLQNGGTFEKIDIYLMKNVQFQHITKEQKQILIRCIKRTYKSEKWSK